MLALAAITVANASIAHIYPAGSGQTYHSPTISGSAACASLPIFQYQHQTSTTITAYGTSPLSVDKIGSWGGWENSSANFDWGAVSVVDNSAGTSTTYTSQVGTPFTNYFHQWIYEDIGYTTSLPIYIEYRWGDAQDIWCQFITRVVIHGA